MSFDRNFTTNPSLRIVSLPYELQTSYDIKDYIENQMRFGKVDNVKIITMKSPEGIIYRSAYVNFDQWRNIEDRDAVVDPDNNKEHIAELFKKAATYIDREEELTYSSMPARKIHYTNDSGKKMEYIKFVAVQNTTSLPIELTGHLELQSEDWASLYIPCLPDDLSIDGKMYTSEKMLKKIFEETLAIGEVSRIDFVTKKIADSEKEMRTAYVHFEYWSNNPDTLNLRKKLEKDKELRIKGLHDGFTLNKFDNNRFIVLKINYKPIPEADGELNIHQLAAFKIGLEKANAELQAKVESMQKTIDELMGCIAENGLSIVHKDVEEHAKSE